MNESGDMPSEQHDPAGGTTSVKATVGAFLARENSSLLISYLSLRRVLGFSGILLPWVVMAGAWLIAGESVRPSISAYYHTCMRDVFVGLLVLVGSFLITYKGFDRLDDLASTIAGIAALGVATFPNDPADGGKTTKLGIFLLPPRESDHLHVCSAAVLFVTLACISLFLFTKTDASKGPMTRRKLSRNAVYRICGVIMLGAIAFIAICAEWPSNPFWNPTLLGETAALMAFGTSWLVKGEFLLGDDA